MKEEILQKFRRLQTITSVVLFFIVFTFFYLTTNFNLTEIQLSNWGVIKGSGWVFNLMLMFFSITIFLNPFLFIKKHSRIKYKNLFYFLFSFVALNLFFIGVFNLNFELLHEILAFNYFLIYPLVIFIFSHLNRNKIHYKEWITHLTFSILMSLIPFAIGFLFKGMAISEMVHTMFVIGWNLYILKKSSIY